MGLGKSAQMLAYLESTRKEGDRDLLVVPASLIGNWQREIAKFTPDLDYCVFSKKGDRIAANTLTITTYGMMARYIDDMKSVGWRSVILDEAQAIKNAGTKQSKAARQLNAGFRVVMTGTPVENRLEDLWSLFDFSNPGLLGTLSDFKDFTETMAVDTGGYSRLRNMTSPFILRRLKTDKSIIDDLPDKLETVEMISLSKKQRILYNEVLSDFAAAVEDSENRVGLVLSVITKFKQICNHPDQYLGQKVFEEKESGKFVMLREICEAIFEQREKVLVFTQYKEMTGPLSDFLADVFGRKGLVFHGGMTKKARDDAVLKFNSENEYVPYMVISLKAGGTGLNLTSANHVIHFDRWWNPAVENQATDRAFRIGQTKDVLVHKFVCEGTLEEKIDAMIQSKKQLATDVIGEGESWISKMDNDELLNLFRLE
jgi:non-specific serine/threonine protein kinase